VTPTLPRCARYAARSSGFTDVPVIQGKLAVVTMVKCLPGSRSEVAASCWGAVPRRHIFKGIPARVVCRSDARGGLLQTCSRFSKKPSSFSGSSQIRGGIPAMANFTHSRHPESNEGVFVREGFPNKPSCRHIIRTSTDLWLTGCRIQQRLTCYRGLGDSQIQIRRQSRISINQPPWGKPPRPWSETS
jgi:hypothetical protein